MGDGKNDSSHSFSKDELDEFEKEDEVNFENQYEENNLLILIKEMGSFTNYFNSFDWTKDFHKRTSDPLHWPSVTCLLKALGYEELPEFEKDYGIYESVGIGLEEIAKLDEQYKKIYTSPFQRKPQSKFYLFESPVELFLQDISYGWYPPPEILCSMAKAFRLYFLAKGELTLEDVFFGQLVKGAGNYSKRKSKGEGFKEFHYQVLHNAKRDVSGEKFSLDKFAALFLKHKFDLGEDFDCCVTDESIDNFLKGYHRWKNKNLTVS
jgi:hypothetical protein